MKKLLKSRILILSIVFILNALILYIGCESIHNFLLYYYGFCLICTIATFLVIIRNKSNENYQKLIVISMLMFPLFSYALWHSERKKYFSKKRKRKMQDILYNSSQYVQQDQEVIDDINKADKLQGKLANYLLNAGNWPIYNQFEIKKIDYGKNAFDEIIDKITKAKKYVFIEISEIKIGEAWEQLFQELRLKARDGVEVKILYDEEKSVKSRKDKILFEKLENHLIFARPYNKSTTTSINLNTQKNCFIIDGDYCYICGNGITDDIISTNGDIQFKDGALCISGSNVWSSVVSFINAWKVNNQFNNQYEDYKGSISVKNKAKEYIQIFDVVPEMYNFENKNIIMQILSMATKSLYIMTDYVILSKNVRLILSALIKSGIDVRLILSASGTRRNKFAVSRSYYEELIKSGVKVYEYSGYCIKESQIIIDENIVVEGNFCVDEYNGNFAELAVVIYNGKFVKEENEKLQKNISRSHLVTLKDTKKISFSEKLLANLIKFFM